MLKKDIETKLRQDLINSLGKKRNVLPYMIRYETLKKIGGELKLKTLFECAYCEESFFLDEKDVELMREIVEEQHGKVIADLIK
jgi:hypothetical protein